MALNKDFQRFTQLLSEFNNHLTVLKSQIDKSNSSYKEIVTEKEECKRLSFEIQRILKEGTFNKADNLKVRKLNGDFQKLLKTYEQLIIKVKNIQTDQISDLQVKSKRASAIGMSLKLKDHSKEYEENNNKNEDIYDDDDLHQHVEHYEEMILEKANEIKEVEKDVISINQMMKDVAKMVVEQGEQITHIEVDIKQTHQDVKDAEKELISAKDYHIAYKKKVCCVLGIIITVVTVIVLIVVFTR